MAKDLVIVESPAKARTINKYLGDGFVVKASVGHVRDLPTKKLAVDIEHDFMPEYEVIRGKAKVIAELKKAAKAADKVYLAPDPDREGEAIAWHVAEELGLPADKLYRVLFNEITKKGVLDAMERPGKIDINRVDAQQARRVLDRLVGYQVSPLLWKKVRRGLSAGRVQSVAVRLVCEREAEIQAFVPKEFWSVTAHLRAALPPPFTAKLAKEDGKKLEINNESGSDAVLEYLKDKAFLVSKVEKKEKKQYPVPPFTTSKLQQEAARKLRFTAKKTMAVAQQLYEGLEVGSEGAAGLITYMRTDSTRLSPDAVKDARDYIGARYGQDYLPAKPPVYASQKKAQEAHEAIRPTSLTREPDSIAKFLDKDQLALYRLIWNRFIASQMSHALLETTGADISAGKYTFRATGTVVKFPGFMAVYTEDKDEERVTGDTDEEADTAPGPDNMPPLKVGDLLKLDKVAPKQHFTQPPPRYTEASLVKELEEKGIGRPSTYAAIMSTIVDREYVEKKQTAFFPTELGVIVNDLLVQSFPDLFDVTFTAKMEDELDTVEEGKMGWVDAVRDFYGPFSKALVTAQEGMRNVKREETPTEIACDKCGKMMVIKWGRNGKFLACPGYPECRNTRELPDANGEDKAPAAAAPVETTDEVCPKCGSPMIIKSGRFGKFLACSAYPGCKTTKPISVGVDCPKGCGGFLNERRTKGGKSFFGCSNYPKCDFASWDRPVPRKCPDCGSLFLVEKYSKKDGARVVCPNKECKYKEEPAEAVAGGE